MAKLEIALLVGADSKTWLQQLTNTVDKLEKLVAQLPGDSGDTGEAEDTDTEAEVEDTEVEETEDEAEVEETEEEGFTEPEPPVKKGKGKAKKVTMDDVNDACKKLAAKKGRPAVLAILKKKFKVESITALEEEQYADVIKAVSA